MRSRLVIVFTLLAVSPALADDYPLRLIDRPLAIPDGSYEPFAAFALLSFPNATSPAPSSVDMAQFALDIGVAPKVQVGAYTAIEVSPQTHLYTALASAQYQLVQFAAVRADLGLQKVDSGELYGAVGIGLPVRLKLSETVALISSRPYAWSADDDIVQVRFRSDAISDFHFPVGLLVQLDPHFSFAVRSGYRYQGSAGFVPAGADAVGSFGPLDIGVTFDIAGQISPSNGNGYFDVLTTRAFAQLRL